MRAPLRVVRRGHDGDVDTREGKPERAAHIGAIDAIEQTDGRRLGQAVSLSQLDTGDVGPPILELAREDGAAADAHAQRRAAQVDAAPLDRAEHGVEHRGHADDLGDAVREQLGGAHGVEAVHRPHARAAEERCAARHRQREQMREGEQGEHVVVRRLRHCLHRRAGVGEHVGVREDGAERHAAHGRRVDDHRFLVAAADVALALDGQPVMRAQVDVLRALGRDDASRTRRVVEQHDGDAGRHARGERCGGEHRPHVRVAALVLDLDGRSERVHEHRAAPLARGERGEVLRRRRQEDGGALPAQCPHERRAALEQREPRGDELLRIEQVATGGADSPAARGEGDREQGERIAHVRGRPCGSVRSRSAAATPSTARRRRPGAGSTWPRSPSPRSVPARPH
jgi:hypothetical protein